MPRRDKKSKKNWRYSFLLSFFVILAGIIVWRLFNLQIENFSKYQALAQNQSLRKTKIEASRGRIFFSDKKTLLADNIGSYELGINPEEIKNPKGVSEILATVLNRDFKEIYSLISNNEKKWILLKRDLPLKDGEVLKNIPGVYLKYHLKRYYPQGKIASHSVGFLGERKQGKEGQYGIEGYFEKYLKGKDGKKIALVDAKGEIILPFLQKYEKEDGCNLILTLDFNIQFKVEELLDDLQKKFSPQRSLAIVSNPLNGEILAMASLPNFDPNFYFENPDYEIFKNPGLLPFEPGSIFKPITMAGALEEKVIGPQTTYIDQGEIKLGSFTIKNANRKAHGKKTMTEVLELSLNTGAVFAQQKLGNEKFLNYIKKFGFGKKTGIELQGEEEGSLENIINPRSKEKLIEFANASFGQGISVTPLQLIQAFSAIANQGKMAKPRVVKEIECQDGKKVFGPRYGNQVISPETALTLTAMMVSTIEKGYGKKAKVEGYSIAGKTGTAQVIDPQTKRYFEERTIHSFIAFAPAFSPKFLIFLKMDFPKGIRFAADSLAPSAGELAKYLFSYFEIPPSKSL